jgi:precorrin 3B synthase CobZ
LTVLRQVEARERYESARRLRSTIGTVFRYAIATARAQSDSTVALKGALISPKATPRAAITDPKAFGALLRAIDSFDGQPGTRIALKLMALLFPRPGELRATEWSEFDFDKAVWSIPATRMKMRRPHRVPLAAQAITILKQLHEIGEDGPLLFPGIRTAERPISDGTLNNALRRLGYDNRVRQLKVTSKGFPMEVEGRVVIASSGGFQANIDWLKEGWGPAAENFLIRGTPYAKGRVLRNLLDQGIASVGDPTQCHAVAIDGRAPKFDGGIATRLDCVPFSIVVNRDAQRFYDEGQDVWPKRYAIWGRLVAQQPGQVAYSIIDSRSEKLFMPSVFPAIKAGTVGALAEKLGLPPTALEETVKRFNEACQPGAFDGGKLDGLRTEGLDPPKTNWARPIVEPPFIGYPLRPGITFTYLGVKVNERAEVIMQNGQPAENLFASGEIMAGSILGKGYLAGFGMAIGTVFGRIAGKGAAHRVRH